MLNFKRTFFTTLLVGLGFLAAFFGGYFLRGLQINANDLPILLEAKQLLIKHSYNPPKDSNLEYGMIRGMVQAYGDPYTSFSEPVQHELSTNNLEGKFGGIGVQLKRDEKGNWVLIPIPDSPALQAGIEEGDILVEIENLQIKPETDSATLEASLRGQVNSKVKVVVRRLPEDKILEFTIKRDEYSLPSVIGYIAPIDKRLGILQVNLMAATTPSEILDAVEDLKERGAEAYALDLRNNFGGLLTSGVDTARIFLENGRVMQEQYKGEEVKTFEVETAGQLMKIKLVVLVNHNTASAAEITAGALQARQRALLIGTQTYGKNTVQLVFELQDQSSLQVTAAKWWIPDDSNSKQDQPELIGIQPDILIDDNIEPMVSDLFIVKAVEVLFPQP